MSFASILFLTPLTVVPFSHLLLIVVELTLLGGLLMFFRPLLLGVARALVLLVRPRPARRLPVTGAEPEAVGAHS